MVFDASFPDLCTCINKPLKEQLVVGFQTPHQDNSGNRKAEETST